MGSRHLYFFFSEVPQVLLCAGGWEPPAWVLVEGLSPVVELGQDCHAGGTFVLTAATGLV